MVDLFWVLGWEAGFNCYTYLQTAFHCLVIFLCAVYEEQAEDVIGSLLKEYLNVSEKQGQLSSALESSNEGIVTCEEKDTYTTNAHNDGESSCQEPENCSSENDGKELQNQLQGSSTSKHENSSVQFKNVVAIVDPPRMGLHPTVSIIILLIYLQLSMFQFL